MTFSLRFKNGGECDTAQCKSYPGDLQEGVSVGRSHLTATHPAFIFKRLTTSLSPLNIQL